MTTTTPIRRHFDIAGAYNVRDLGGYRMRRGGETRWGSFLRADSLHEIDPQTARALVDARLVMVIDLRTNEELQRQPNPFAEHATVRYVHISLFGALDPIRLVQARDPQSFGMAERYREALDTCQTAIAAVMETIATAEPGLILFNCTAGKDRTGIIAALLLSLAGVEEADIVADYALTAKAEPMLQRLGERLASAGYDETLILSILASEPQTMQAALHHLNERHGGAHAYLITAGLSPTAIREIERRIGAE